MKVVKKIVETDIDILHQVSSDIDMSNISLVNAVKSKLLQTYEKLDRKCQGISAIQVGYPYKAVLLRYVKGEKPIVIFNPKVYCKIGNKKSNEGCLSEGDSRYIVKRPILIKVGYIAEDGTDVVEWLPYKKARIFMHEYDHLDGILLQDKGVKVEVKQ